MTPCSSLPRTIGAALLLLTGCFAQTSIANGATAPIVSTLPSITEGVSTPVRLAHDQLGNIYVTDPRGGGLNRFDNAGKLLKSQPLSGAPLGVAVDASGNLLVSQGGAVKVLDKTSGTVRASLGPFLRANAIALDARGLIYVTDSLDNCVQVFNADYSAHPTGVAAAGKPANSFGAAGQANGLFLQPTGISYEKAANQLAVVDTRNGRIQFFDTAGVWQKTLGSLGAGPLKFTSPQSIAFEYATDTQRLARMYVVDAFQGNIQVLDGSIATPAFLRYIGNYGFKNGNLVVPSDLLFDSFDAANARLIVANGTGTLALYGISAVTSDTTSAAVALTVDSYPLATNQSTLTLSGTAASGATVRVNGLAATVSGTTWSAPVQLNVGSNPLTITATLGSATASKSISIIVIAQSGTPVSLTVDSYQALTKSSVAALSGTITSGATVTVNGAPAEMLGTTWRKSVSLAPGTNNFQIVGSKEGLSDATNSFNITLDNVPPKLTANLLSNGSTTQSPVLSIYGTVSDESATSVTASINGTVQIQLPVNDGAYSLSVTLPVVGPNTVAVTAGDAAGNLSETVARTITYNPMAPVLTDSIANGSAIPQGQYIFTLTAPEGFTVTVLVNGQQVAPTRVSAKIIDKTVAGVVPAGTPTDVTYTFTLSNLDPGAVQIEEKIVDPNDASISSSVAKTVTYSAGLPWVAVTSPLKDIVTASQSYLLAGKATPGAALSVLVNGAAVKPNVASSGDYFVTLPLLSAGSPTLYAVTVSATDVNGATVSCSRNITYDARVPRISIVGRTYSANNGGFLYAKDSSGKFVPGLGGSGTLVLGSELDPATLNIYAVGPGGESSRNGDLNGDGTVDISDAVKALQFATGAAHQGDVDKLYADLWNSGGSKPVPDGQIRLDDVMVILYRAIGFGL